MHWLEYYNLYFKIRRWDQQWVWPAAWLTWVKWRSQYGWAPAPGGRDFGLLYANA